MLCNVKSNYQNVSLVLKAVRLASTTCEHGKVPSELFSLSFWVKSRYCIAVALRVVCMQNVSPHRQLADAGAVLALYTLVNMIRRRGIADPGSAG